MLKGKQSLSTQIMSLDQMMGYVFVLNLIVLITATQV